LPEWTFDQNVFKRISATSNPKHNPSTVGDGDAFASPRKNFWTNLSKSDKIWANLITFEQNQNLASPKT